MKMRATFYAVVAVLVMVITAPWSCTRGEEQRREDEDERTERQRAMEDAGDVGPDAEFRGDVGVEADAELGGEVGVEGDAGDVGVEEPMMDVDEQMDGREMGDAGDVETLETDADVERLDGGETDGGEIDGGEIDETEEPPGGFEGDPSETSLGQPGDQPGGGSPGGETDEPETQPPETDPGEAPVPNGDAGTPSGEFDGGIDTSTDATDRFGADAAGDAQMARDGGAFDTSEETGFRGVDEDIGEPDTEPTIEYEVTPMDTGL